MRIALDLQACQSPGSGQRGIGRYTLALTKAMLAAPRNHEFVVVLNASMPDSIEAIRGKLSGYVGHHNFAIWRGLDNAAVRTSATSELRGHVSSLLREDFLAGLHADYCHTMSLFEGWSDDVATAIRPDISNTPAAVTLYDLIPLARQDTYLADTEYRSWYLEKIENLRRAQLVLGISEFTCAEARQLLGLPSDRLVNISGAVDDVFQHLDDAESMRATVMRRYGMTREFVMYAGGFDERKNLSALIDAYARMPAEVRAEYQLLMVGSPSHLHKAALEQEMERTGLKPDEVIFCGYVPDRDLVCLYNLCALYVFPSLQEGFGLPALEAMTCGALVIGSNTSSLPEVIGWKDALFDPSSVDSIAQKMLQGLQDEGFRSSLREHALLQPKKFSWQESARRALDAFEEHAERRDLVAASDLPAARRQSTYAWLPAYPQRGQRDDGNTRNAVIFAADGCPATWIDAVAAKPLSEFDPENTVYEKIVIDVFDHPYCTQTLLYANRLNAELHIYSRSLTRALAPLAVTERGRKTLVAMAYEVGGYAAVHRLCEDGFHAKAIDETIDASALYAFEECTVVPEETGANTTFLPDRRVPLADFAAVLRKVAGADLAGAEEWREVAESMAVNRRYGSITPQILVDISHLFVEDAHTGIQRVVKSILSEILLEPPAGYRVEPVVLGEDGVFRYARSYCNKHYFPSQQLPSDEVVEFSSHDLFLGLDLAAHLVPVYLDRFLKMKALGVRQYFVIYDLLPILRQDCFDPNSVRVFRRWYEAVARIANGVLCISRAVADEFETWLHQARPQREQPLGIGVFHLGADLPRLPAVVDGTDARLAGLEACPTFLMVGTVEPRKGHAQALSAFERLWKQGIEVNLLVVGKPGWLVDGLLQRLREHPLRGRRLFWFEHADDKLLLACYARASALLMASEGEGFGLPLIEAAHHGLPLVARDLPVFREIVGDHAHYFSGLGASDLASSIEQWLLLAAQEKVPQSGDVRWKTWRESAAGLLDVLLNARWVHSWKLADVRRHAAYDYRFHTQVGRLVRGLMETTGSEGFLLYGPYVPLEAGLYRIDLYGIWDGKAGAAWMDVCSAAGTDKHGRCDLVASTVGLEGLLGHIELALDDDVRDLEVRVGVYTETRMRVRALEIHPLHAVTEN